MSLLDILHDQKDEVLHGVIYKRLPKLTDRNNLTTDTRGQSFGYDIVNDRDSNYANLLNTIEAPITIMTIKTSDKIDIEIGYKVKSQDGRLWEVSGFVTKLYTERTKQTLRQLKKTVNEEKIIRLTEINNPWEL